jgi:pSer/pThr/pTyr-binding forkhead associated (FHA) protein
MSLLDFPDSKNHQPITNAGLETSVGEYLPIRETCTLGRSSSNDLVLHGEKVSRHHAAIHLRSDHQYWLNDLGSVNGTWLNGRRIATATELFHLDQITIGPHRLVFKHPDGRTRRPLEPSLGELTVAEARPEFGWVLLLELASSSWVEENVPSKHLAVVLGSWLDHCKGTVESHGGVIGQYLSTGVVAAWHDRTANRPALAHALGELTILQSKASPPFSMAVHYGPIHLGHGAAAGADKISGAAVNFLFRIGKLSTRLRADTLVSEVARALLEKHLPLVEFGRHAIQGFEGEQLFYRIAEPRGPQV